MFYLQAEISCKEIFLANKMQYLIKEIKHSGTIVEIKLVVFGGPNYEST